jgi:hypothetical protein
MAIPSVVAFAQTVTTPCDPQFMQAMEARAWLEAQREITQNENLIVKPDSVLEYSCFIGFLGKASANYSVGGINRPFSETDAWQTIGFSTTSTDESLNNVVASALATYIDSNYPHKFLGGRLTIPDNKPNGSTMAHVDPSGNYACDNMARIWEQARCQNFDSVADQDGFRDFLWYADQNNDPRKFPGGTIKSCKDLTGTGTSGTGHAIDNPLAQAYQLTLKEAFNGNQAMFVIPAADDKDPDGTMYKKDDVKTYFDLILPDKCSPTAIKTGVKVFRNGSSTDDAICPNPGCSYSGGKCS